MLLNAFLVKSKSFAMPLVRLHSPRGFKVRPLQSPGQAKFSSATSSGTSRRLCSSPNLPTKIIPTKICRLNISGKFTMDMRTPPLKFKILLESKPSETQNLSTEIGRTAGRWPACWLAGRTCS